VPFYSAPSEASISLGSLWQISTVGRINMLRQHRQWFAPLDKLMCGIV
jgi:hypothetical protein